PGVEQRKSDDRGDQRIGGREWGRHADRPRVEGLIQRDRAGGHRRRSERGGDERLKGQVWYGVDERGGPDEEGARTGWLNTEGGGDRPQLLRHAGTEEIGRSVAERRAQAENDRERRGGHRARSARAPRSILPLALRGISSSSTNSVGTMYECRRDSRNCRSA